MMQITLDKALSKKALDFMEKAPDKVQEGMQIALFRAGQEVRTDAIQKAPYQRGDLRRSITTDPMTQYGIKDRISIGSNLIYARIQDKGGIITPKKAKWLTFKIGGRYVRTKKVVIPKYKGIGYLTPAFKNVIQKLDDIFLSTFRALFK